MFVVYVLFFSGSGIHRDLLFASAAASDVYQGQDEGGGHVTSIVK